MTPQKTKSKVNFGYTAYRFRKDEQDPIIDKIKSIFDQHDGKIAKVAAESGVSAGTLTNWFNGTTRRPQFATTAAVVRTLGYDFVLAPVNNGHASVKADTVGQILRRFPTRDELERST